MELLKINFLLLNSKPLIGIYTTNLLSDVTKDFQSHKSEIRFYILGGYEHDDIFPTINYRWGTAIVLQRNASTATVIVFPETTGDPLVNYYSFDTDS